MSFVNDNVLSNIDNMSRAEIDDLPFGAIKVDDNGVIQLYNEAQTEIADYDAKEVEGQNWFEDVAVCTNNRLVYGKFKKGVSKGDMDTEFNYTFTFKMKPTNVKIRMYQNDDTGNNWIFCQTT